MYLLRGRLERRQSEVDPAVRSSTLLLYQLSFSNVYVLTLTSCGMIKETSSKVTRSPVLKDSI